jgi:hypothetical protein
VNSIEDVITRPDLAGPIVPRMADFAVWAAACETALWPAGSFGRAYQANRRTAIEGIIDADPIAACVRERLAERSSWTGSAADLLRAGASRRSAHWPKNSRALAGQLRRAQTFLRALGIEISSVVKAEREQDYQDECYYRKYRQHRQHRQQHRG